MGQVDKNLGQRTTKARSDRQKAPRFNDMLFVQYELDKTQQEACKNHEVTSDQLFDELLAFISDGYKVTFRYDSYNECYSTFMQSGGEGGPNAGYILTGRGSTPLKAFKQLVYKHRVCLDGEWGQYVERRGGFDIDD